MQSPSRLTTRHGGSARRDGVKRLRTVDYSSFYCSTCFIGLYYCTIRIDMNTRMRPTEQRMGGLTVEEQAAIDQPMAPYRREWGDSPALRRYERVPHSDAHAVAQKVFELAGGKL